MLEEAACLLCVAKHFGAKGVDAGEFPFWAQVVVELELNGFPVEVAGEVEEERLCVDGSILFDGWAHADICDGGVGILSDADGGGVDAELWNEDALWENEVNGWEPLGSAEVFSLGDGTGEDMGMTEVTVCAVDVAVLEEGADQSGMDLGTIEFDHPDDIAADTEFSAHLGEEVGVTGAMVAEVVIVTGDEVDGVPFADEVIGDKGLPRLMHPLQIEVVEDDVLDTVKVFHQPDAVVRGIYERDGFSGDEGSGMDVEGEGGRDGVKFEGALSDGTKEGGVAEVDAVEEAQSDHAWEKIHKTFLCGA